MRLAVHSHCVIDTIRVGGSVHEQIGGPACYCGLTARQLGFGVDLHSRFGADFPSNYLAQHGLDTAGCGSDSPTTRFEIEVDGADRTLAILHECDAISREPRDADAHIVSPVYREITPEYLAAVKEQSGFVMMDPQGFLRNRGQGGTVALAQTDVDLGGIGAVKASPEEAACMAPGVGVKDRDGLMVALQKKGAEHVLLTDKADVSLLVKDKVYSITLPNKEIRDTTGVGDIFCAAFCCTMLKERDFLWALCFAGGAAQAALASGKVGLQKVPRRGAVQTNASYFYNLLKFRDL